MDINNILIKYFGGKASKEELTELESWKAEAHSNLEKMKEARALWEASEDMKDWDDYNLEGAWDKVSATIQNEEANTKKETKVFSLSNLMKVAAIGVLLIAGKLVLDYNTNTTENIHIDQHITAVDAKKNVSLPDGTIVMLGVGSTLDYKANFLSDRSVTLSGNAYFDVERDENSPFKVYTGKGLVEVLGTEFNILDEAGKFELLVTEGKVSFDNQNRILLLTKDDLMTLDNGNLIKSKMFNKNYLSWKEGQLIFRDALWMDVFKDLSRHYKIDIDFDKIKASNCRLNTTIKSDKIEDVLEELKILWDLNFEVSTSKIEIISVNC